jgi:hypothetical protein
MEIKRVSTDTPQVGWRETDLRETGLCFGLDRDKEEAGPRSQEKPLLPGISQILRSLGKTQLI